MLLPLCPSQKHVFIMLSIIIFSQLPVSAFLVHIHFRCIQLIYIKRKTKNGEIPFISENYFFKNMFTLNSLEIYIYEMRVSMSPVFILQYFLMHSHISIDTRKVPFIYFLHSCFDRLCIRKKCFSDSYLKSEYCLRF